MGVEAECPTAATLLDYEDTYNRHRGQAPKSQGLRVDILCKAGGNMESHPANCNSKHKLGTNFWSGSAVRKENTEKSVDG